MSIRPVGLVSQYICSLYAKTMNNILIPCIIHKSHIIFCPCPFLLIIFLTFLLQLEILKIFTTFDYKIEVVTVRDPISLFLTFDLMTKDYDKMPQ